jgi:ABC-type glutathione transport system ATPase component
MTGPGEEQRMTVSAADAGRGGPVAPAAGLSQLGAETEGTRSTYGEGVLIMCDRLVRIYAADGIEVQALQGLDLLVAEGELTAIVGASGSGKSTLVNILAGLDTPTAGKARVAGHDLATMSPRDRLSYRRTTVGFIWQQTYRNLLPYLTALQNVIMPMRFAGLPRRARARRPTSCSRCWGSPIAPAGRRPRCPAASSSAPRSPPRWRTSRGSCWPTSRPVSSTARPPGTCSPRSRRRTASSR